MASLSLVEILGARDRLFLALGTIEGRAARLHDALDGAPATAPAALLASAVIDGEDLLERARITARLDEITQGRPAGGNRLEEHGADMAHQILESWIIGVFL